MKVKIHLSDYDIGIVKEFPSRINVGDSIEIRSFFKQEDFDIEKEVFDEIISDFFYKCTEVYWGYEDGDIFQEAMFIAE
jgi:hypothetical protein